ncbi:tail-specific protease [Rhodocytophaga rosea]|uniref:Tail-specific protease n=2 Tax=Rhodocytophaga rosea TaxID=2704465 RepID=A0A6C0GX93_9BACT|nr:tail-specific protease [Rhodocytophaga rosea]
MKKTLIFFFVLLTNISLLSAQQTAKTGQQIAKNTTAQPNVMADLRPDQSQAKVEMLVTQIMTQGHYRKVNLDDSLSSVILDKYLQSLDNSKVFFLASDVANFEKYRKEIDNDLKKGELEPAYQIFNIFKTRFDERMTYVSQLLEKPFDFTVDENYETDREKAPWPKTVAEANEEWRKMVKSQALNLKLSGKKTEEISKMLKERYENQQKAITKSTSEDVFEIYMNSFSNSVDPHTSYFSPAASDNFKIDMSLSLEGIGASLRTENDYTKVAEIIAGGPAFKSKLLQKDDKIVAVAQGETGKMVDVIGWRIDEVVKLIRGPKGTTVRLQIIPADAGTSAITKEIKLVRDKVKLEEAEAKKEVVPITHNGKPYKMGVITIPSFYMDFEAAQKGNKDYNSTTKDVRKLIKELNTEKVDGLIIDLRFNGGGSLSEAIELTGLFIKDGPVVQVRNSNGSIDVGKDPDAGVVYTGPLAVMINRFSASASEIFAGAIQDYKRGIIIGEQTYGKGTVQNLIDLNRFMPDEKDKLGQVKLTIAKFYRVTGSSTQHKGVSPDIGLPSRYSAEEFGESSQPSALPWDQIRATSFTPTNDVTSAQISKLESNYEKRLKSDPELKQYQSAIEDLKKAQTKTVVSLQESKRKKERDEIEQKRKTATKIESTNPEIPEGEEGNKAEDSSKPDKKPKDLYLNEGAKILADYISIG